MARIAGVNIPNHKKIKVSLTYIFGIGLSKGLAMIKKANIDPEQRVEKMSDNDLERIRKVLQDEKIEGDLRSEITQNIKRLKDISSYRGVRHIRNLPVRGQRTKTNARTKRGKKVTVGSGRRSVAQKT